MKSDHSSVFRKPYPDLSEASLVSAVMGHAVICLQNGLYQLVWWEGDQRFAQILMWEECRDCGVTFDPILESCPGCIMQVGKVA